MVFVYYLVEIFFFNRTKFAHNITFGIARNNVTFNITFLCKCTSVEHVVMKRIRVLATIVKFL